MFFFPNNSDGCRKFQGVHLDREGDPDRDFSPIVLVDRGGCSFVTKAVNVQELGGALALITNNRDDRRPEDIIMIDDGSGANLVIPTVLISKSDGAKLKTAVNNHNKEPAKKAFVVLIVNFDMVCPPLHKR